MLAARLDEHAARARDRHDGHQAERRLTGDTGLSDLPEVVAPAAAPNWRVLVNVATVWSEPHISYT